jgi:hypothetical protein
MALAELLAGRGDLDELRARTDAGDGCSASALAELLVGRGNLDEAMHVLRTQADAGDGNLRRLAELLKQQDRSEEAKRLRQFGLAPDGSIAYG